MPDSYKHPKQRTIYIFMVNNKPYGIDVEHIQVVKELHSASNITPIPHARDTVIGYMNVKGEIYQILSLSRVLLQKKENLNTGGLIVFFKAQAGESFGAYVSSLREITEVERKNIDKWEQEAEDGQGLASAITSGVCNINGELIPLISPQRLYETSTG